MENERRGDWFGENEERQKRTTTLVQREKERYEKAGRKQKKEKRNKCRNAKTNRNKSCTEIKNLDDRSKEKI